MSLSDKDLLTGSDQSEPRWKDDFEKSVGLFFFHMLCFSGYLSPPSCPYQSLFFLVNTHFLLVYWGKQCILITSRMWQVYSERNRATYCKTHAYIYIYMFTDHGHHEKRDLMCVCGYRCVNNGWGSQTLSESRPHCGSCYCRLPSE